MNQHYLFVHFKEKTTPDGEQMYFGLSRDGLHWEDVGGGNPVLWCYYGTKGARDFTIVRDRIGGRFVILATDLSVAYGMRQYGQQNFWEMAGNHGSACLSIWESEDLVNWSEQRLIDFSGNGFGCVWAPDVIFDEQQQNYVLHWSSGIPADGTGKKRIYYSRTADFKQFTRPEILYGPESDDVIDSAMYEEDGKYYLFVKSYGPDSHGVIELCSDSITGPFARVKGYHLHEAADSTKYEAPTCLRLPDGRWCLFLDYYGAAGAAQGYVPFIADSLAQGNFVRSDAECSFPYRFKHGTVLPITEEEYERIKTHDWSDKGYVW